MTKLAQFLTVKEALSRLLNEAKTLGSVEEINTLSATGRVLAESIYASMDVPSYDRSDRDGYAIHLGDMMETATFPISQRIQAGQVATPLLPNTAARIFTGAMIPKGADAVIMQEYAEEVAGEVVFKHFPKQGEWVQPQGGDVAKDSMVLKAGTRLRAQELGLLASLGVAKVTVNMPLRVAIFSTGDELAMPGEAIKAGQIFNSNRYLLRSLLESLHCKVSDYGIVADSLVDTRKALTEAAKANDIILTSGGVSVGEEDYVKQAVQLDGELKLWQIAMKPGKPFALGAIRAQNGEQQNTHFIGLPGNPVAVLICFMLYVRPFILRTLGVEDVTPKSYQLRADFDLPIGDARNEFLRAKINDQGGLDLFNNQNSAVLTSTVWGDGLIDNPPNGVIRSGDHVRFIPFSELTY